MIKHCLGNSQINSIPAWRKQNFSLQNKRKSLRVQLERTDIYIRSRREIKEIFDPENAPFK